MKRFKQFITEEKQVGIVYYYTSIADAGYILRKNILKTIKDHIHFSRDAFHYESPCRLVIDGTKLSQKYKIEPKESDEIVCRCSIANINHYVLKLEIVDSKLVDVTIKKQGKYIVNEIPFYSIEEIVDYFNNFTETQVIK